MITQNNIKLFFRFCLVFTQIYFLSRDTALIYAARKGRSDVVKALLKFAQDYDHMDMVNAKNNL